jgi:hypothetical protein
MFQAFSRVDTALFWSGFTETPSERNRHRITTVRLRDTFSLAIHYYGYELNFIYGGTRCLWAVLKTHL